MVCIGWIESLIPHNEDRESLSLFKSATSASKANMEFTSSPVIKY